jgi:type VI secretion system protein ImpG
MNREFLELYNRELRLLYENAKEFAEEFPGVAERLGGLSADSMDPMISGLLEGSAFLAARVQLKLKHEFPELTHNLLEQLVPHYLAPTPSAALIRADPPYAEPNLKDGARIAAGAYLEARYIERERRIACKFRLASDIVLWPFEIARAEFFPAPAPLQALGLETGPEIMAGMQISLIRRCMAKPEDEPNDKQAALKPDIWFSRCRLEDLPVHLICNESDAVRIYEKLFAHCRGIYFRYLNEFGDPVLIKAPPDCLQQIGFRAGEELLVNDKRVFRGFDLLRELFVLPAKFLGFRLTGLAAVAPKIKSRKMDVIFTFDQSDARLASAVRSSAFSLHTAPIVNLFELTAGRVPVKSNEHEYHVVPDRSRYLDYEAHRVLKMFAHFAGSSDKVEVYPLYSAPPPNVPEESAIFYTVRRMPRRRTVEERRYGKASNYTGTDLFLSLANHGGVGEDRQIAELSVRVLCSNRHLTEHLPTGQGGADFILEDNTTLPLNCVAGPTLPAESIVGKALGGDGILPSGTAAWRLISILSLNHLGLTGRGTENSAEALRELLSLFANTSDSATERRIRGILAVESRPIVRRIRQANGTGTARGLEIALTFDEKAFEGSGIFLYGAVLDRFFAEYVPVNNLVQTVIKSSDRGEVMRWPPRLGTRVEL